MSDEQDVSEEIDPDELGDDPGGDVNFPAERYLGATDRTRDEWVSDSVASRSKREDDGTTSEQDEGLRLSAPGDVWEDDESEAIGEAEEADDLSAEESAIHVVEDS